VGRRAGTGARHPSRAAPAAAPGRTGAVAARWRPRPPGGANAMTPDPHGRARASGAAGRCLVVHPGALGDVLLALPALTHLGALGFTRVLAAAPRLGNLVGDGGAVEEAVDLEGLGLHHLFVAGVGSPAPAGLQRFDAVVSWLGAGDPEYARRLAIA